MERMIQNKKNTGALSNSVLPGTTPQRFEVFNTLKVVRSLYFKDRKHFIVRIPAIFVNGFASCNSVSISPATSSGEAYVIIGLTDTARKNMDGV